MAQYSQGAVSVTKNSNIITGTNTSWIGNVLIGNSFKVKGESSIYNIASVDSDTQLTLTAPYEGETATNVAYLITRDFTPNFGLYEISAGDVDWTYNLTQGTIRKIDSLLWDLNGQTVTEYATITGIASESLSNGDFVNIYYESDTQKIRKANASTSLIAHGFVTADYNSGDSVTAMTLGVVPNKSGLTPGVTYFLVESGGYSTTPSSSGVIQSVGQALSPTKMVYYPHILLYYGG